MLEVDPESQRSENAMDILEIKDDLEFDRGGMQFTIYSPTNCGSRSSSRSRPTSANSTSS
jgi:hypothetical protein